MTELEKRVEWLELQMRLVHRTLDKIDRKTEPFDKDINVRSKTEPQYDIGEYADRLWKIAYERGKREALEQTERSE